MRDVDRIQEYLRENARGVHIAIEAPPFTVFINFALLHQPADPKAIFAIPHAPTAEGWPLDDLCATFTRHKGVPRVRFVDTVAPSLIPALAAAGFSEVSRFPVMQCVPHALSAPPPPQGYQLLICSSESPLEEVLEGISVNLRGFQSSVVLDHEFAEDFRSTLVDARAFMAREASGEGVAVGMYSEMRGGVTELVGITTLPTHRGRGYGSLLTVDMARAAFDAGAEIVFLVAASAIAERLYRRIGFTVCGHLVEYAYVAP